MMIQRSTQYVVRPSCSNLVSDITFRADASMTNKHVQRFCMTLWHEQYNGYTSAALLQLALLAAARLALRSLSILSTGLTML